MKKKLIAGIVLLLICMFPVWCFAGEEMEAEVFHSGEWEYCLNEDGSVTISCWNGEAESLAIPGELGGRKVSVIGDKAFNACTGLKEVIIPDSVTQIGGGAFYECSGLVSVSIPDSVTQIEDYAFCLCTSLAVCERK